MRNAFDRRCTVSAGSLAMVCSTARTLPGIARLISDAIVDAANAAEMCSLAVHGSPTIRGGKAFPAGRFPPHHLQHGQLNPFRGWAQTHCPFQVQEGYYSCLGLVGCHPGLLVQFPPLRTLINHSFSKGRYSAFQHPSPYKYLVKVFRGLTAGGKSRPVRVLTPGRC